MNLVILQKIKTFLNIGFYCLVLMALIFVIVAKTNIGINSNIFIKIGIALASVSALFVVIEIVVSIMICYREENEYDLLDSNDQ